MRYQTGDMILHGTQGVCKVSEIAERDFYGDSALYYVLKPAFDEQSTIYVPVHKEAADKLRRILSVAEVVELIKAMPDEKTIWIENEMDRRQRYKAIISRGDRRELVQLIKTIYLHAQEQKTKGKKVHVTDERFMCDAEKILYEEFAHVLKLNPDQVAPFIAEQISIAEKREQ